MMMMRKTNFSCLKCEAPREKEIKLVDMGLMWRNIELQKPFDDVVNILVFRKWCSHKIRRYSKWSARHVFEYSIRIFEADMTADKIWQPWKLTMIKSKEFSILLSGTRKILLSRFFPWRGVPLTLFWVVWFSVNPI